MSDPARVDDDEARIAIVSAALIDHFGARAIEVAERQAAEAYVGDAAIRWATIVGHLSRRSA